MPSNGHFLIQRRKPKQNRIECKPELYRRRNPRSAFMDAFKSAPSDNFRSPLRATIQCSDGTARTLNTVFGVCLRRMNSVVRSACLCLSENGYDRRDGEISIPKVFDFNTMTSPSASFLYQSLSLPPYPNFQIPEDEFPTPVRMEMIVPKQAFPPESSGVICDRNMADHTIKNPI